MLRESGVGCYTGKVFVGAFAYADDIAMLAPTPSAMRRLLRICDQYVQQFSVVFNAAKSAWLHVSNSKQSINCVAQFYIGGLASEYVHLRHIVSASLDDKNDILTKRNSLCVTINNVLCYFWKRDQLVKLMLL